MYKKVALAFTGGLQSSVCLHWLVERRGAKVMAVIAEIGQQSPTWELGEYAVSLGASGAHIEDCCEEFCRDYAFRALRASAIYERRYLLSGALARPLIAAVITRIARQEGCHYLALGTSSRSNDLHRFEMNVSAFDADVEIIRPDEIPPLRSRQDALKYAEKNGIVPPESTIPTLSYDTNLWGGAVAADGSLGTWEPLPEDTYRLTANPMAAPQEPEEIVIEFYKGNPVAVNGEDLAAHTLVQRMNEICGRHGIGRAEVIEDRLTGQKSREVYEAPGSTALMEAHSALEELTLDYKTLEAKSEAARWYAELVYDGLWFSQLRNALDAFMDVTQEHVSGKVRLRLFRGSVSVVGRQSEKSLYNGNNTPGESPIVTRSNSDKFAARKFLPFRVVEEPSTAEKGH
ncbi:MAG: argininosuccinate synthase [Candidatus Brocadiia bacterium]